MSGQSAYVDDDPLSLMPNWLPLVTEHRSGRLADAAALNDVSALPAGHRFGHI